MVRIFFLAAGLSCLGACTGAGHGAGGSSWQAASPAAQGFRFDWQLSGDPAVAPLQVFDDGRETWLQFAPGQALPAIFGVGSEGERALPYVRRDPYVVVVGTWKALSFRGGRLSAKAQRAQSAAPALADAAPAESSHPETPAPSTDSAGAASTAPADTAVPGPLAATPPLVYRAAPPDSTLRAVLGRWADMAGWTFHSHHWAVDVDIPLSATAEFPGDFKSAVRGLLGATELADRPLQPCFYSNRVLRVVPIAQSCSRMTAPQGAAA